MEVEDLFSILQKLIDAGRGEELIVIHPFSEIGEQLTGVETGEVRPIKLLFGYDH